METPSQGHGGHVPAATLLPCARPNGSEGNGIGNARGIPPRGVGRRHLFGCQGGRPSFRGRTARGSVTISATSLARVQRGGGGGGQSWTLCPRVRRHVPLAWSGLAGWEMAEARARGEHSTAVLACVKEMGGSCLPNPSPAHLPTPVSPPRGKVRVGANAVQQHLEKVPFASEW